MARRLAGSPVSKRRSTFSRARSTSSWGRSAARASTSSAPIFCGPRTGPATADGTVVLAEHAAFGWQAQQHLADRFEMHGAALTLLRSGMDVAHAAFERVCFENRRGAGGVIDRRDNVARLVDRPSRGETQLRVMLGADLAGLPRLFPHLADDAAQIGARRFQPRLALRDLRLDHIVLAQRAFRAARHLIARDLDKGIVSALRDAHRDMREAHRVDHP